MVFPEGSRTARPPVFRVRLGERFAAGRDPDAFVAGLEAYFRRELRAAGAEEEGSAAA
jgi:hypothetical protein